MKLLAKIFKNLAYIMAGISLVMIVLAFTSAPFWAFYRLGIKDVDEIKQPDAIVLLSGGGMPSSDGLFRVYMAAEAAKMYPKARLILSIPGDTTDQGSSISLSAQELVMRGININRISYEMHGTNTRSQALGCLENFPELTNQKIILVTNPVHMRRAVLTFEKAGFLHVGGFPAFERVIESNLHFEGKNLGGRENIPDVGHNINLRYRFWSYLQLEIKVIREYFALAYYQLKGWI